MSNYLWDKSGAPDPEVERLELMLGRFRHQRPAPEFPERVGLWDRLLASPGWWSLPRLAAVALTALLAIGAWFLVRQASPPRPGVTTAGAAWPAWDVSRLAGTPTIAARRMGDHGRLAPGQALQTDASSSAILNAGAVGEIQVDPGSRLRLVESGTARHRLALELGTIHAMIWAPPGEFVVDTPSAVAVDLGCAYTLHVDDNGASLLRVTFGWVGFTLHGHESFIPKGAMCATRPGIGPGTPYFADAAPAFRTALEELDFGPPAPQAPATKQKSGALDTVLANARPRDALTLWHLLARLDQSQRALVYNRLAALAPPPSGVSRQGILSGDKHMRDLWWNALGLGDTSWWRMWERDWPAHLAPKERNRHR
jgi:hypothetical protein